MMSSVRIEDLCVQLTSNKVTERKKASDNFLQILQLEETTERLNRNGEKSWSYILSAVHNYLVKEALKICEDKKKRETNTQLNGEIFYETIKFMVKEGQDYDVHEMLRCISSSLGNDDFGPYLIVNYLKALRIIMLPNEYIRSRIQCEDWNIIYGQLKRRYEQRYRDSKDFLETISQFFKYGPLHGLSAEVYRQEFDFVTVLCKDVNSYTPRPFQVAIVEIVYYFCLHTSKDNRLSCCKFGEETFSTLFDLYEIRNPRNDNMKVLLIRYLLMQMVLHHPKGVSKDELGAFAYNWEKWTSCVRNIYKKCQENILHISKSPVYDNQDLVITKNGMKYLQEDFVRLFVESLKQLSHMTKTNMDDSQQKKRLKIMTPLMEHLDLIEREQHWTWINATWALVEYYSNLLSEIEFIRLLQILAKLQVDSKDPIVAHHIYCCLCFLKNLETSIAFEDTAKVENTWNVIRDTTLRSFGLNQNDPKLHVLLQKLILTSNNLNTELIFRTYTSDVLDVTQYNLETLDTIFNVLSCHFNWERNKCLINWIVKDKNEIQDYRYLSNYVTSKVLIGLTLQKWPTSNGMNSNEICNKNVDFEDIADVYMKNEFGTLLVQTTLQKMIGEVEWKQQNIRVCSDSLKYLMEKLISFIKMQKNDNSQIFNSICIIALLKNVFTCLLHYQLIEEEDIDEHPFFKFIGIYFEKIEEYFNDCYTEKNIDDLMLKTLNESVDCFNEMLSASSNPFFDKKFRELVPTSFLDTIISFLVVRPTEKKIDFRSLRVPLKNLRKSVIRSLINYSCNLRRIVSQNQKFMLDALAEYISDINEFTDCELPMLFLSSVAECKVESLEESSLQKIFFLVYQVCKARYKYYSYAVKILKFMYAMCPLVGSVESETLKDEFMDVLYPFYIERKNFGPEFSVALVDCIGRLHQVDPECKFSKWENIPVVQRLPEFLCSNFQEVRFAAIKNLILFFETSAPREAEGSYFLQETMFKQITQECEKIFEVEGTLTEERKVDETVTRSASVLHVFASILLVSYQWRNECLFYLLKMVQNHHLMSFPKVLKKISQRLSEKNDMVLLEKTLDDLIRRWVYAGLRLDDFPFFVYNCENKFKFYEKYWRSIVPFIIEHDIDALNNISESIKKPIATVFEESFDVVIVDGLKTTLPNLNEDIFERNVSLKCLLQHIGEEHFEILFADKIDNIMLNLVVSLNDENDFFKRFGVTAVFVKSVMRSIDVKGFQCILDFMKNYISSGAPVLPTLYTEHVDKLQRIMMHLNLRIHNQHSLEDKMKAFHQYSILNDLIMQNLHLSTSKYYFIRDTCYCLLRFIKDIEQQPKLGHLSLIYLRSCLEYFLQYPNVFIEQLEPIVTTLIKVIVKHNEKCSELALNLLNYLFVDNIQFSEKIIISMVDFPDNSCLAELSRIQYRLKSDCGDLSLKKTVEGFVNSVRGSTESCSLVEKSLKNLKVHLAAEKRQLKNLYEELREFKGFSENCEDSLLHQLIGLLIDLCQTGERDVTIEALKCLGELGPSDLMTLIVRPDKYLAYTNFNPLEFFTGQIISLLSNYIIDNNPELITPSVKVLYGILNTKEGRKVLASEKDYGYGHIVKDYLYPFSVEKQPKSSSPKVDFNQLISRIVSDEMWCPSVFVEYNEWIKTLLCSILEAFGDSYIPHLAPLCQLKIEFCEILLPSLVYLLINLNNSELNMRLTGNINKFFEEHWIHTTTTQNKQQLIVENKKAVKVMLSVVHFIRVNKHNIKLKKNTDDLRLDYLKIAKAAQYCSAHFTSLLYVELWCYSKLDSTNFGINSFKNTILDYIKETETEELWQAVVNISRSSYKAIGDTDSLQGCGTSLFLKPELRREYFKDAGLIHQSILLSNIQLSRNEPSSIDMLVSSLKQCGLYETSLLCQQQDQSPDYECLWRLSEWSLPDPKENNKNRQLDFPVEIEKYKYYVLKNIHESDVFGVRENIQNARILIADKLKQISLESSFNLYNILAYLQGFNEIEDFVNADTIEDLKIVTRKWNRQDDIDEYNFKYIEPVMTQRIVMLKDSLKKSDEINFYKDYLVNCAVKLSEKARSQNQTHIGIRALESLHAIPQLLLDQSMKIHLEDAQLNWKIDNELAARKILSQILGNQQVDSRIRAIALKLSGEWSIQSFSENSNVIINDYFLAALELIKGVRQGKEELKFIHETCNTLGRFADRQYQQVTAHISSDVFQKKMKNMQKATETVEKLLKKSQLSLDEKKAKAFHTKQSTIDKTEIDNTKRDKTFFLHTALKFYLKNLLECDDNNLQIFRVMALFLENRSSDSIEELAEKYVSKIPSYKFLLLLPQLIPHIADRDTEDFFSRLANYVVEKCAREHPHHTLPIVFALANSHKDSVHTGSKTKLSVNEDRVSEAKKLIHNLERDPKLNIIITQLELLSDALVELAYAEPKSESKRTKTFEIPKNLKIRAIENFDSVAVLTEELVVNKNGNYDNIVGVHRYEKQYKLVGGNNKPKKITCIGTDGKPREQLVKGEDDLRQDAVMQQVFTVMNTLLSMNKQTCSLKIRTYKIVALSMRSGILEWAKNTMPVGTYLVGDDEIKGAHEIFRPRDYSSTSCRKKILEAAGRTPEKRLKVFNEICENFKPVFHKFFEENFLHPTIWYERKRAFIHSVATTSMCGYILGIGDRHVSNILIDKTTAEVVHIDFGIAFEQGKILPTPETVPFRLTRDFVDAMGICGIEGAFKRSCERTMSVMKDNHETIMAILGVLLYDPLYSWTVSAEEANRRQRGSLDETSNYRTSHTTDETDNTSINTTAERALLRLKSKLQGIEEGTPMSVEHQVSVLIHQAMDPANLSKLFHGWQAFL